MDSTTIIKSVESVTKKWTKQRKAEERGRARSRSAVFMRMYEMTIKDAAWKVMEEAYLRASDDGRLPAHARQIMYQARGKILVMTGRSSLDDQYFTQKLVPEYIRTHPEETAAWDVVYDARGHLAEPHTGLIVPIGTLEVREYLKKVRDHVVSAVDPEHFQSKAAFPTCGPKLRFGAIMFIEKEGFLPLFRAAKLAERYDIAIMSTKGMPVVACRHLADVLCGEHKILLLVLHDFDKAGFSILGTLQDVEHDYLLDDYGFETGAKRYEFCYDIEVVDLGLRLADVEAFSLEAETVGYRSDPSDNLRENGATDKEVKFLCGPHGHRGKRVELNAFTSGDFIQWIESKLKAYGIKKVLPDNDTLKDTYRRAYQIALVQEQLAKIFEAAGKRAEAVEIPRTLDRMVRKRLKEDPEQSWDAVIAELAAKKCKKRRASNDEQAS